jgi:exodeoxyribonuclease V alpha subunit
MDRGMKNKDPSGEEIQVEGEVKRITFRADDGYTVLRLQTELSAFPCVGYFIRIGQGDRIRARGRWVTHPRYGEQFSVDAYEILPPQTQEGIIRYLSSGLITGIGRSMAERIVKRFGDRTIEIIDKEPNRLREIAGLGHKRVSAIKKAWREHREISELMVFLESHGIRAGGALKIYRHYGPESIATVRENPYRLASEIWGIGFATADRIAFKMGISQDAPARVRAGIKYVLSQATDEGHVYLPEEFLRARCTSMLGIGEDSFEVALTGLVEENELASEGQRVYIPKLLEAEKSITRNLRRILQGGDPDRSKSFDRALANMQIEQGFEFDKSQLKAICEGSRARVSVVTGGPGTGKTTIVRAFVRISESMGLKIGLAAPTGRAAKRMGELAGRQAKTIHRLLEYSPQENSFRRNADNPVDADVVIIDEASMLDIILAASLMKAIRTSASVIFVGDVDQLPPVGPGNFLSDMIEAHRLPVVRLTRIFRQEEGGAIVENAHRINRGELPLFSKTSGEFFLIEEENPPDVANLIVDLCARRLPAKYDLDPVEDIQVLAPMYKGDAGATNLNQRLQDALNRDGRRLGDLRFRIGDKVMQLRNNYEKMVFNGDLGRVVDFDPTDGRVVVRFDFEVEYDKSELDEITLAYAITVHKSQGSEFKCVVMPVLTQHYIMLHKNLLYTAVTRARSLVVAVGTKKAVGLAVRNVRTDKRYSSLAERLAEAIDA